MNFLKNSAAFFASFIFFVQVGSAQVKIAEPSKDFTDDNKWSAQWIACPNVSGTEMGVFHFRKDFELKEKPQTFVVNVSADNRYRLFVNGEQVCFGPARGCPEAWYYETIDIAPFLKVGKNVIGATVWNAGAYKPLAQTSVKTAFLLQSNGDTERIADSNRSWSVIKDDSYEFLNPWRYRSGAVGGMEKFDAAKHPWGWEKNDFDASKWEKALVVDQPINWRRTRYGDASWVLVPRDIPLMEETPEAIKVIRRSNGVANPERLVEGKTLLIPANTKSWILFDQTYLTTAYPELTISGGKDASIALYYAENLYGVDGENSPKGNRNEIDGKDFFKAPHDIIIADGGKNRVHKPLWMRTYRYLQINIQTKDTPLVLENFRGIYTGYPFKDKGFFRTPDDSSLAKIWEVGWRTARLCAHETYFDCPYYEQLQYIGDTRIQALISLYLDGDARLMRKAIKMFNTSRKYQGLPQSRYPANKMQLIPPFTLIWINMLHDYHLHCDDPEFVAENLNGVRSTINWYLLQIDPNTGILKSKLPYWNFVDWVTTWETGIPPESEESGSSVASLHLAYSLDTAADLMRYHGFDDEAKKYALKAKSIKEAVMKTCWNPERGLLRDCAGKEFYSQHANTMGILTDAIPHEKQQDVFKKITTNVKLNEGKLYQKKEGQVLVDDGKIVEATFYYKFYVVRAMNKVGMTGEYLKMLEPWREMIAKGLSTFPETPDPCRSECHAWSSSPNYDLLASVCGIMPDSAGYKTVKIAPNFCGLKKIDAKAMHYLGGIELALERDVKELSGTVKLPEGLTGKFLWGGKEIELKSGINKIEIK